MTAPTSDERREVAETMRVISGEGVSDLTLGEVLNSILTGGAPRPTTEMAILARLADLIDPTSHKVIPSEIDGNVFCSNCGAEIGEYGVPNYCHNCGHRLVSSHD